MQKMSVLFQQHLLKRDWQLMMYKQKKHFVYFNNELTEVVKTELFCMFFFFMKM